ncbi:MAG TPA: DUF6503 family protein [Tepidisphaeraceae bacterium]|jgi:hypothetical protein
MIKMMTLGLVMGLMLAMAGGCYMVNGEAPTNQQKADRLANGVELASGAAAWPSVQSIGFTFVVRDGDVVKVSRNHLWNMKAGTDTVSAGDKVTTIDLKNVDMNDPAQADAFKAWTNDSYWLLMPLKLFDGGVKREYMGRREVQGKEYEVLHLSFDNVGMTPGDQYNLYVDPLTSLVTYWDYMPNPDTTMLATWEQYRHDQGLVLSTYHKMGAKVITIENLSVASE